MNVTQISSDRLMDFGQVNIGLIIEDIHFQD